MNNQTGIKNTFQLRITVGQRQKGKHLKIFKAGIDHVTALLIYCVAGCILSCN